jgi:transcriptional regulator with XRE-family HTH domain
MRGREVRAIRKRLGISQRALGDRLGVAQNTVARWERGEANVTEPIARLIRIAGGEPVEAVLRSEAKRTAKK